MKEAQRTKPEQTKTEQPRRIGTFRQVGDAADAVLAEMLRNMQERAK